MLVATVEKLNGNWYLLNFLDIDPLEENILTNWVNCSDDVRYYYQNLRSKYGIVCIKEEDIQKKVLTTDSFIFSKKFTSDLDTLEIEKAKVIRRMDRNFNNSLRGLDFMQYINFIMLFNYFASKGIFITEENKEDKYIEILELDDEEAIEKLEEYLNIQEMVSPFIDGIKERTLLKEEIEYSTQEEFEALKAGLI